MAVTKFTEKIGIHWKTVFAYAPMSSGRAERMAGTIKRAISKKLSVSSIEWEEAIPKVLYGYRRRKGTKGNSPFELLYGETTQ